MTARTLLETLGLSGVILTAEPHLLRYRAPVGTVTPQLKGALRTHKAELVRRLARPCPFCKTNVGTVTGPVIRDQLFYLDTNCANCNALIECVVPARQEGPMQALSGYFGDYIS
jgi:hypothetical protein